MTHLFTGTLSEQRQKGIGGEREMGRRQQCTHTVMGRARWRGKNMAEWPMCCGSVVLHDAKGKGNLFLTIWTLCTVSLSMAHTQGMDGGGGGSHLRECKGCVRVRGREEEGSKKSSDSICSARCRKRLTN